MALIGTITDLH